MASKENYTAEVSSVNNAVAKMKRQAAATTKAAQMKIRKYRESAAIQESFAKALSSLQKSTVIIASNLGKLAVATSRTISSSVAQYSKAISEDINVNKQNLVATALSQTTPIFGYFVAKFMETDVFRRLREKVSDLFSTLTLKAKDLVVRKFREKVPDMFSKITTKAKDFISRKKQETSPKSKTLSSKSKTPITIAKSQAEKIPKLQKGGLVEKTGLVKVHAGEIVAPIHDVLKRVDESITVTRRLARISQIAQLNSMARMSSFVKTTDVRTKQGIIKGFLSAYEDIQKEYEEPANVRLLRAVLAIQDSLGAQMNKWKQIWARMLLEHPVFRNIVFSLKMMKQVIGLPLKLVYPFIKSRGGYQRDLSHSKNPFKAIAENTGIIYVGTMWRLDNIALYTKATAQAVRDLSSFVTGYSYGSLPGMKKGEWSIFGLLRSGLKFTLSKTLGLTGKGISQIEKNLLGYKPVVGSTLRRAGQIVQKGIELPALTVKAKREKFYESGLQGTSQFLGFGSKRFSSPIITVSEVHLQRMQKSWKQYVDNNKKLLKISQKNSTLTQRLLKRGKSFFSGIFTKVITFLPIVGSILAKTLFSGFKITRFITKFAFKLTKPLFSGVTKLLFKAGKSFLFRVPKFLMSSLLRVAPLIGSIIGPLIGPALAIAVGGMIGWKIGKTIDNWLGISKKFKAYLHKHDEEIRKLQATTSKTLQSQVITARKSAGTTEGFIAKEKVNIQTELTKFNKIRSKDVGYFGRRNMAAINSAQTKFMQEHIEEYLKYGSEQVERLRDQWLKYGGYRGKLIGTNPITYGEKREKAFLKYLKRKGKPLSSIEREKQLRSYKMKYGTTYTKLVDHIDEVKKQVPELVTTAKKVIEKDKLIAKKKLTDFTEQAKEKAKQITTATVGSLDQRKLTEATEQAKKKAKITIAMTALIAKKKLTDFTEQAKEKAKETVTSMHKLLNKNIVTSTIEQAKEKAKHVVSVVSKIYKDKNLVTNIITQAKKKSKEAVTSIHKLLHGGIIAAHKQLLDITKYIKKKSTETILSLHRLLNKGMIAIKKKLLSLSNISKEVSIAEEKTTETLLKLQKLAAKNKSLAQEKAREIIERLKKSSPEVRASIIHLASQAESKFSGVSERIIEGVPETKAYLNRVANQIVSQNKPIVEEIKSQNKVIAEMSKETAQKVTQGVHSSATVISQNVNNVTNILHDSSKRVQKLTNDSYKILSGRLSQNCPFF